MTVMGEAQGRIRLFRHATLFQRGSRAFPSTTRGRYGFPAEVSRNASALKRRIRIDSALFNLLVGSFCYGRAFGAHRYPRPANPSPTGQGEAIAEKGDG